MTWKQTYSGRRFYSMEPRVEDIDIDTIAHGLSMICRYGGHCKFHYSVAQHSVLMFRHASQEDALLALMHDAKEVYSPFGDLPQPDKVAIAERYPDVAVMMKEIDARIERVIAAKFGLPYPIKNKAIGVLDTRILHDEREHVMVATDDVWDVPYGPLGVKIDQWVPEVARARFLDAFDQAVIWHRKAGAA